MGYDINAMKARSAAKTDTKDSSKGSGSTGMMKWFKPVLGPNNGPNEYDIRFSPVASSGGEPILTVSQYKKIAEKLGMRGKIIAPGQFGQDDPIAAAFELRRNTDKNGNKITKSSPDDVRKEAWAFAKNLQPSEFCAAQIIDRAGSPNDWLLWEFTPDFRKKVFATLLHKDNVNEQMFDENVGYDFTLTVTQRLKEGKPETFNGYPVKDFEIVPRKRPSKLHEDPKIMKKLLAEAVKLDEHYKKMLLTTDQLCEKLDEYELVYQNSASVSGSATAPTGTAKAPSAPPAAPTKGDAHGETEGTTDEVDANLDSAFEGV